MERKDDKDIEIWIPEDPEQSKQPVDTNYKEMKPGLITRTRTTIALVSVFFVGVLLSDQLTVLGEFIQSNEITRTDVPKFRIDVFETPDLHRVKNQMTTLNSTVSVNQLRWSNVFRASDKNGHFAYFKLDESASFQNIEVPQNGEFPVPKGDQPIPFYSFKKKDDKIFVVKNDVELSSPVIGIADDAMQRINLEECPPLIFNYGKSAILYLKSSNQSKTADAFKSSQTSKTVDTPACFYIQDLSRPVAAMAIAEFRELESASADWFGKQFFAISRDTVSDTVRNQMKLIGANFDRYPAAVATFETAILQDTEIFHSGPAAALALVDAEKIRIVSARTGDPISVHYYRDLFKGKIEKTPRFHVLPGLPAAIFGNLLIDMRNGKVVDVLRNFTPGGTFAVDYKNWRLYYSTNDDQGNRTTSYMTVNVYDLKKVRLEKQSVLGPQSVAVDKNDKAADESGQVSRLDEISNLFITTDGKLLALTKPAEK